VRAPLRPRNNLDYALHSVLSIGVDTTLSESRVVYRWRTDHVGCFCCHAIVKLFLRLLIRSHFVNKDLWTRKSVKRTIKWWEPNALLRLGNLKCQAVYKNTTLNHDKVSIYCALLTPWWKQNLRCTSVQVEDIWSLKGSIAQLGSRDGTG